MIMASINFQDKSIWHTFLISQIPAPCLTKTSNSEWDWIIVPVSYGHMESCWYMFTECLQQERVLEGQNTTWGHIADAGQSLTPNLPLCGVLSSGVLQPHICSILDNCERPVQLGMKTAFSKENINELEPNKERKNRKKTDKTKFLRLQCLRSTWSTALNPLLWLLSSRWQAYRKAAGGQWGTELHTQEPEQD